MLDVSVLDVVIVNLHNKRWPQLARLTCSRSQSSDMHSYLNAPFECTRHKPARRTESTRQRGEAKTAMFWISLVTTDSVSYVSYDPTKWIVANISDSMVLQTLFPIPP